MSEKTESKKESSTQSRPRRPLILTKRQQGMRRAVKDTKERQDALQKQHTAAYKAAHKHAETTETE